MYDAQNEYHDGYSSHGVLGNGATCHMTSDISVLSNPTTIH